MKQDLATAYIEKVWDTSIIPTLEKYIRIPNKSPQFDPNWAKHGYMQQAVTLLSEWCQANATPHMQLEVIQLENRTPIIFIEIPGASDETILLYGHLDKQPEMIGWHDGLHPWEPSLRGERLYGRGAADDGYAVFAALTAINVLEQQKIPHARCVILIEASEESGSPDLPFYIEALKQRIQSPSLVICLDSGCGNYQQLWATTSLRGLVGGILSINVLKEGIHSGNGSGVVPSSFRILRLLLNRIEDENSGDIRLQDLQIDIPSQRQEQAKQAAHILGDSFYTDFPFAVPTNPESNNVSDLILRRTWKPALSVIGFDGMPSVENAGNVTLPTLDVKLSMRLPPTLNAAKAAQALKQALESDPPYQAHVHFTINEYATGWHAPAEQQWLQQSIDAASSAYFGAPAAYMGEGGSIPFMGMLGEKFPQAQFLITGVLGPHSNAHGPNEFLHIPTAKKLTACVADIIAAHYLRK